MCNAHLPNGNLIWKHTLKIYLEGFSRKKKNSNLEDDEKWLNAKNRFSMLRYANYSFLTYIVVDVGVCMKEEMSRRIYV